MGGKRAKRAMALVCTGIVSLTIAPATASAIPWDAPGALPWHQTPAPSRPDPGCTQSYDTLPPRPGRTIEGGVGPLAAGTAGSSQGPIVPEDPAKTDAALRQLKPHRGPFAVRLNRLFQSDGEAGIARYRRLAARFARLGLHVQLQVRYPPSPAENGDLAKWLAYVRRVVA